MQHRDRELESRIQRAAAVATSELNMDEFLDDLSTKKPEFIAAVRSRLEEKLAAMEPKDAWSVRVTESGSADSTGSVQTLRPGNEGHLGALWAMISKKDYRGRPVESGVAPVVADGIQEVLAGLYQREDVAALLMERLKQQLAQARALTGEQLGREVAEALTQLEREVRDCIVDEPAKALVIDRATDGMGSAAQPAIDSLRSFFMSASGQQLLSMLGHVMATGAGKIVLMETATAITKVAASGAMKGAVTAVIKKVGVTALLKTAVGKAIVLAVFGAVGVPVEVITLAIVAAVLPYQYRKLPQKLAKSIPEKVGSILDEKYRELNEALTPVVLRHAIEEFLWTAASRLVKS